MLLLVPLLGFAALPLVLRFVVPDMLAARGLPASVGWGYFDPWNLELVLSDLRVGPSAGSSISFAEFRADLVRDALLQGRVELTNLRLRGASIDIDDLSEARLPDGGDHMPFEEVQFRDLRLAGLSEKLGREVVVRHARLVRHEDQGERRLLLEISADAGGAPMEVRGTLRGDGDAQTLEGTLTASGLPARLLDPASVEAASPWSGSVYVVTDFELRLDPHSGRANLRATGSLQTADAGGNFGHVSFAGVDSVWEGTLTLSGPTFELPERAYFQGTLDAAAAQVGDTDRSGNAHISGLHWEGIGGWHGVPVVAGKGSVDSVELVGEAGGIGPLRVDLDHVQLQATLDDAGRFQMEHLQVRNVRAEPAAPGLDIRVRRLEARQLHAAADGIRAEHIAASALEGSAGGEPGIPIWVAEHPVLEGLEITPEAQARAAGATLESLRIRRRDLDISALGARVEELQFGASGRWEFGLVSLDTLEHLGENGREVRGRNIRGESLSVDRNGAWEAMRLRAERIAGTRTRGESWTAHGFETGNIRLRSGVTETGTASLENLVYRGEEGEALEGTGLHVSALAMRSVGGKAERLEAESLRYRTPRGASWEGRALSFAETRWLESGSRSAERTESAELRYRDPAGERWRFDALRLGPATMGPEGEVRIESAVSERTALVLSSGEALEGHELRSGPAERDSGGAIRLSRVEMETLASRMLSGLTWRALPVELESFALLGDGQVDARRLRSGTLSLHDGQGGRWIATGIDASHLQWHLLQHRLKADPLELGRLEFVAAGGTTWSADALLTGTLDWPQGEAPRIRHVSAATLQGSAAPGIEWKIEDLQAAGDVDSDSEPPRLRVLSAGAGRVETLPGNSRFEWSGLRAAGLRFVDKERTGADLLAFEDVSLSAGLRSDASFSAARVELRNIEHERRRLAAESVTIEDSVATLGVDEAGQWMLPVWPGGTGSNGTFAVEVGELGNGGHNRVGFIDRSVDPPFELEIEPYRLRVVGLDSLTPQRAALLEVDGLVDAASHLDVSGEIRAGRVGFDARARVRLDRLDLNRFSEYARRHLDVFVRQGQGDFEFDFELSGGRLDTTGDLVLRDLSLDPEPSAGAAGTSFAEDFPRLAETGEAIELRVSVQGPISDPGFDFAASMGEAIVRSAGLVPGMGTAETASPSEQQ